MVVDMHRACNSSLHTLAPLSHHISLTKHEFRGNTIKIFETAMAEH